MPTKAEKRARRKLRKAAAAQAAPTAGPALRRRILPPDQAPWLERHFGGPGLGADVPDTLRVRQDIPSGGSISAKTKNLLSSSYVKGSLDISRPVGACRPSSSGGGAVPYQVKGVTNLVTQAGSTGAYYGALAIGPNIGLPYATPTWTTGAVTAWTGSASLDVYTNELSASTLKSRVVRMVVRYIPSLANNTATGVVSIGRYEAATVATIAMATPVGYADDASARTANVMTERTELVVPVVEPEFGTAWSGVQGQLPYVVVCVDGSNVATGGTVGRIEVTWDLEIIHKGDYLGAGNASPTFHCTDACGVVDGAMLMASKSHSGPNGMKAISTELLKWGVKLAKAYASGDFSGLM